MNQVSSIIERVERVIDGKPEAVETAPVVLLAEGHLLIEDVPGVGKTVLAKAMARTLGCSVRRIQFTPDLLPSDVTGVAVYDQQSGDFVFKPGAVFANVVIGDEINRASPKTQAALLESMEERQVTVDGTTHPLAAPFAVIATQNPVEMEGTYPLPEAQLDRFMARISMGYPDEDAELSMLRDRDARDPMDAIVPVTTVDDLRAMIAAARAVHAASSVEQYCVSLVRATRRDPEVRLGASPRAALHLLRAAKARAYVHGRDFVLPDDVAALAGPVLAHRIPTHRGSGEDAVARVVAATPVPSGALDRR
jgi:MoxR-like ATPase